MHAPAARPSTHEPDSDGWHARIFARELLAPSSNLKVLFEEDLGDGAGIALPWSAEI